MPYITKDLRQQLDPFIAKVYGPQWWDLYALVNITLGPKWNYARLARAVAAFDCAQLEMNRRAGNLTASLYCYSSPLELPTPDVSIWQLADFIIKVMPLDKLDGILNYCLTCLAKGDDLYQAKMEFYARVVSPYEDQCIKMNGDIAKYEPCPAAEGE